MKFSVDRAPALAALTSATSVMQGRNTIPILSNVLLEAADGSLSLTGTDMDMRVTVTIPARVETPGATTVQGDKFHQAVRSLPDGGDFSIDTDADSRATMKAGRAKFMLPQLRADSFPSVLDDEEAKPFSLPVAVLDRLLEVGSFSMALTDARAYLNCAYLHTVDGKLRCVSTDTHRMAYAETPAADTACSAMLTPKTVAILRKMLSGADDDVIIRAGERKIVAMVGQAVLIAKLLDASTPYPAYDRLIPTDFAHTLTADTDLLTGALNRAMVMISDKTRSVRITVSKDGLAVSCRNEKQGEGGDAFAASWEGDDFLFSINGDYLREVLSRIRTDATLIRVPANFTARFTGRPSVRPLVFQETGDTDWLSLIAPQGVGGD